MLKRYTLGSNACRRADLASVFPRREVPLPNALPPVVFSRLEDGSCVSSSLAVPVRNTDPGRAAPDGASSVVLAAGGDANVGNPYKKRAQVRQRLSKTIKTNKTIHPFSERNVPFQSRQIRSKRRRQSQRARRPNLDGL